MRTFLGLLTIVTSVVLSTACTKTAKQPAIQEGPKTGQKPDESKTTPGGKEQITPSEQSSQGTSVPLVLDENVLKKTYAIDTSNMRFKFQYLETKSEGELKFESGNAHLDFKGLKDGIKGDLQLELLEGTTVKLRGETKDLVLTKGPNSIKLVLKAVGGSTETAELVVSVEIDQPPTGGGNPVGGGGNPVGGGGNPVGGGNPNAMSFAKNVKPILEKHCAECHHPGGQAPDLTSKSTSESRFDKVVARIEGAGAPMPPKPRDSVSASELETLKSWKSQGFNQ